ncbi:FAD-dependent oxidoreductase [Tistrella mobilis]|uniref:FAD-dependent oxidoreductase n=1 Tax=Tistrella mobilis TaxID=171437 RepID=UPI0035572ABE
MTIGETIQAGTAPAGRRVVVVGAGPAGLAATEKLLAHGLQPIVVAPADDWGGRAFVGASEADASSPAGDVDFLRFRGRAARIRSAVRLITGHVAWAIEDGAVLLAGRDGISRLAFDRLVLATGAETRPIPLPGGQLSGVTDLGTLYRAPEQAGSTTIGQRPVLIGGGPGLYEVADRLVRAGRRLTAVVDLDPDPWRRGPIGAESGRPGTGLSRWLRLVGRDVPVLTGITRLRVEGDGHVERIVATDGRGETREIVCDTVGVGHGMIADHRLLASAGVALGFDPDRRAFLPQLDAEGRVPECPGLYVAGEAGPHPRPAVADRLGAAAGLAVASDLGIAEARIELARMTPLLSHDRRTGAEIAVDHPYPTGWVLAQDDDAPIDPASGLTLGRLKQVTARHRLDRLGRAAAVLDVDLARAGGLGRAGVLAELIAALGALPLAGLGTSQGESPAMPVPLGMLAAAGRGQVNDITERAG